RLRDVLATRLRRVFFGMLRPESGRAADQSHGGTVDVDRDGAGVVVALLGRRLVARRHVGGVVDDGAVGRGRGRGEGDRPRLAGGDGPEVTGQQGTARDRVGRAGARVGATRGPAWG